MTSIYRVLSSLVIVALINTSLPVSAGSSADAWTQHAPNNDLSDSVQPSSPIVAFAPFSTTQQAQSPIIGGIAESALRVSDRSQKPSERHFEPFKRLSLLAQLALDYTSYVYSHSDILLFAYEDSTYFEVYSAFGSLVWSGTLNAGQHCSLTPGAGVYLAAASRPFSINVGDALTDYVWGYYAVDQYGKGLSTLFYTYQASWYDILYDPHFIVFGYQDNTQVEIKDTSTGWVIWSGILNDGEHYSDASLNNAFLTVSSNKPVAALSYTDQGYYVPASNSTFVGRKFHTYLGNSGNWAEDLNLIAYENTGITVKNSDTGSSLWSGTLNAGQVHSVSGLNGAFVTVESSGNIAVSVSPFISWSSGRYYHSLYAQDSSGTGIGTQFAVPAISTSSDVACRLIMFSYDDNANVTVSNSSGANVWSGILNRADSHVIETEFTVYTISSSGELSTLLDCGDQAGADFAAVHYAVVQVNITSPLGGNFYYGSSILVTADVMLQNAPLLAAIVVGRISLTTGSDYLEFEMNDAGINGDASANDGTYSANIIMPGPDDMRTGNYYLLVSAQKEQDGKVSSGNGSTIFTLTGNSAGALAVTSDLNCPNSPEIFVGDTCALSVSVTYPDGSDHSDGSVNMAVLEPGRKETVAPLTNAGNNIWQGNYTFTKGGRYLLDIKASPPPAANYIAGYHSLVKDVFASASPLQVSVAGLPGTFLLHQIVAFTATVTSGGQPVSNAMVTGLVNPGSASVDLVSLGEGLYTGLYVADTAGDFTADFRATSPLYKSGAVSSMFTVSETQADLLEAVRKMSNSTKSDLSLMKEDVQHVAEDGDWFWQKIPQDRFMRNFNLIVDLVSLGLSANQLAREWEKAATKSTAPVASRFAGVNLFSWLRDKADNSIDGRTFRSWATRLETSVQSGLFDQYLRQGRFPPYIGLGVLRRASVYYTSKLIAGTMDEAAKLVVGEYLASRRLVNTHFLRDELYPIFSRSIDEDVTLIDEYALAILMDPPTFPQELEENVVADLNSRRMANYYFMMDIGQRNWNLWSAQDMREAQDNAPWYEKWGLILWKTATPVLVGVIWGGPVGAGVGVVICVESLVEDLIRDTNNLNLDERMHSFAYGSMGTALETKESLVGNSIGGLAQVRSAIPPEVPKGRIISIDDVSRGDRGLWFSERQAVSSITIQNTGDYTADYNIRAYYDRLSGWQTQFDRFWSDSMRDPATGETVGWVKLAPGETRMVEVVFKDKDQSDLDMRPNNGDAISFVLAAVTLNGFYFMESQRHEFNPQQQTISGDLFSTSEALPTLSHPIATQLGRNPSGTEYVIKLDVDNPLPYPISIKVRQSIPTNLTILSPNGGMVENSTIQWRHVIQPHDNYEFIYTVRNDSPDRSDIQVPAAELTFYALEASADVQFTSVPVTVAPPNSSVVYLPLVLKSYAPDSGFNSQFNGSAPGWETHSGTWWIASNAWYTTDGISGAWASASYAANFTNFDYQATLLRAGCEWCANHLVIRGTPNPLGADNLWYNFYIFQYSRDGRYSVWKEVAGGTPTALQNWTSSSAVNQGDAWNTLRVVANGTQLYFYINGTLVWSGSDSSLTSGQVGIGMYRDSTSTGDQLYVDWAKLSTLGATGLGTFNASDKVSPEQQALNDEANRRGGGSVNMAPERP
jgi:hypothetical protein